MFKRDQMVRVVSDEYYDTPINSVGQVVTDSVEDGDVEVEIDGVIYEFDPVDLNAVEVPMHNYRVEILCCRTDHTWYVHTVRLRFPPDDLNNGSWENRVYNKAASRVDWTQHPPLAYMGLYSVQLLEEQDHA